MSVFDSAALSEALEQLYRSFGVLPRAKVQREHGPSKRCSCNNARQHAAGAVQPFQRAAQRAIVKQRHKIPPVHHSARRDKIEPKENRSMELFEKTLRETTLYDGKILRLHVDDVELPNGNRAIREIVEHSGGVCVAALSEQGTLRFVRQFRYPYHKVLLELPAGKLEKGEEPLQAGLRELEEECGLQAEKVVSLGCVYPTVAYCSEIIHLFLATGLHETQQHFDEDEFLEVEEIALSDAVRLVMENEITDSKTVAAVLKIARLKEEGKL